jgi:peptidoglycan-associated lipoprotein
MNRSRALIRIKARRVYRVQSLRNIDRTSRDFDMRRTLLATMAAAALLAACSTSPDSGGNAAGGAASSAAADHMPGTDVNASHTLAPDVADRVFFARDDSTISAEGKTILERQAAWLQRNPKVTVTVEGHCDERGTREYNLALGARRAEMVKRTLVALGIDAGRIQTISYGKERPSAVGSDDVAWAQNRRAVTVVS